VTILREGRQQTLILQVDSKHKTGSLRRDEVVPVAAESSASPLPGN
jgi:hypothetical protein